jgi:hypothetical protein
LNYFVVFLLLFLIFCGILVDMNTMTGYTASEMAAILDLPLKTVQMRLFRAGETPLTKEAVYSPQALEIVRNAKERGRPPMTSKGGAPAEGAE